MTVTLYLFGRELVSVHLFRPPAAEPGQAREASEAGEVKPPAGPFGFAGGTFGSQDLAWQPDTARPIDTD
ncbi:hypothetical protein [Spirillospora sp. CA-294931]|uniref:hypothetical protein n=1 Tax=Spirillospora sp. CA-294931 TaxID=3240042 RepID=UPI003D8FDBE2